MARKLTEKRMNEMLSVFAREAVKFVDMKSIAKIFEGESSWSWYFEDHEEGDGMVGVLAEMIGNRDDQISEKEFTELARPYIGKQIARDLGAKKVTIEW